MQRFKFSPVIALAVMTALTIPSSAFLWFGGEDSPTTADSGAPIALNLDLSTYQNVAIQGYLEAADYEGDPISFQLTSTPARGGVTFSQEGGSQFTYTPYENKTGKDSFTYVAVDELGNTSPEATVSIQIDKPSTSISYADLEGDPAHKSAIRLAEEGIFVGKQVDGIYYFDGDTLVSRNEFLTMAMTCCDEAPLEGVSVTGFYDDDAIPTWAKGYVSSALMAGAISGSQNQLGQPVFQGDDIITQGECTAILNQLLNISNVQVEDSAHWAEQSAANLAASSALRGADISPVTLDSQMTRSEVATLLDGALDVQSAREPAGLFGW